LIVNLLAILSFLHLHHVYRWALWAKYSPTDFGDVEFEFDMTEQQLQARREMLEARSQWKRIGGGYEGTTYAWNGHAIKTYHHPMWQLPTLRNCVPREAEQALVEEKERVPTRWPAEIPASVLLAGRENGSWMGPSGFIPVTDFFFASTAQKQPGEWHLVTPLVAGGNLLDVVGRMRVSGAFLDYRQVDEHFRPSFHRVLETLQAMHDRGFCHDDIKADNVFVGDGDADWILGDLGSVREVANPFHRSRIWQNHRQRPDCRANDAFRAVNMYLGLLRELANDRGRFDEALFEGREPWSRLYWMAEEARSALSASKVLQWSKTDEPADAPEHYLSEYGPRPPDIWNPFMLLLLGRDRMVRRSADRTMGFQVSETWERIFALTDLFGAPV
ncbi:hypothetical protein EJ03DRAFT_258862, partial [Teratosphaeria nubilosa]